MTKSIFTITTEVFIFCAWIILSYYYPWVTVPFMVVLGGFDLCDKVTALAKHLADRVYSDKPN